MEKIKSRNSEKSVSIAGPISDGCPLVGCSSSSSSSTEVDINVNETAGDDCGMLSATIEKQKREIKGNTAFVESIMTDLKSLNQKFDELKVANTALEVANTALEVKFDELIVANTAQHRVAAGHYNAGKAI